MICSSRTRFSKCAQLLQYHPDADLIYSDEDKLTEKGFDAPLLNRIGRRTIFFPAITLPFHTVRAGRCWRRSAAFDPEFDGAQDYDLFLRVIERTNRIDHIPRVLYHWRRSRDFHRR